MAFTLAYEDGGGYMGLLFTSRHAAMHWGHLADSIKDDADVVTKNVIAAGCRYSYMTAKQKKRGERWMAKIRELRQRGRDLQEVRLVMPDAAGQPRFIKTMKLDNGLPPSIRKAELDYEALKRRQ